MWLCFTVVSLFCCQENKQTLVSAYFMVHTTFVIVFFNIFQYFSMLVNAFPMFFHRVVDAPKVIRRAPGVGLGADR